MKPAVALLAALLAFSGFMVRLPSLGNPPLDFHPARQYWSAAIARAMFLEKRAGIPDWSRENALAAAGQARLEPPILERAAAVLYRLAGGEKLWLPRLASVVFWVLGSLCVFALARRLFSGPAALMALAVCLFTPYGIAATRSFQPDPLMAALTCAGWLTLVRHDECPGRSRLFWAVLTGAAAALVKPMALFFLVPAGIFLAMGRGGLAGVARARWHRVWIPLIVLPAAGYYLFQYLSGPFRSQEAGRFIIGLWASAAYWRGWLRMLSRVIGAGLLGASAIGLLAVRSRPAAPLIRGLWAGYAAFGLVFNYHIHTHDYYSLPFIPVVALSLAALVQAVFDRFRLLAFRRWRIAALALLFAGAGFGAWRGLPGRTAAVSRNTASAYERLGEILGYTPRTIVLDGDYGLPVFYHGELAGGVWPLSFDLKKNELMGQGQGTSAAVNEARFSGADYFISTSVVELNAQPALADYLKTHFPRVPFDDPPAAGVPSILVYDLRPSRLRPERESLNFGALTDGTFATGPQTFHLIGAARTSWTAISSNPAFAVTPGSGAGSAPLTVSLRRSSSQDAIEGSGAVVAIVDDGGTAVASVRIALAAFKPGHSAPPFGCLDSPPGDVAGAPGPVFFSGWALDDIEVKRILLLREPAGREAPSPPVMVAEVPMVAGARPDIEKAYGGFPFHWRAGWGIVIGRESLPSGTVPYTFHVDLEDVDGHRVRLGTRVVSWAK